MPMKVPGKAVTVYMITILYAAFIFYLSSSSRPLGSAGSGNSGGPEGFLLDKLDHVIEYAVLGMLLYLCFHLTSLRYQWIPFELETMHQKKSISSFLVGFLYGVSDELHQEFVPGRTANPLDVVADAIGIVLGVMLMPYLLRLYRAHIAGKIRQLGNQREVD